MLKGIILSLCACLIWGPTFVIPAFLSSFSSLEITLGQYFFYGVISLLFFGGVCYHKLIQYPLKIWMKALWFALISNIVYYTSIILAVQYSSASVTALIVGIAPISISFYGNLRQNECDFSKLLFPALLIATGLCIVNVEAIFNSKITTVSHEYLVGLVCAFVALISWTWYVVMNTQFLKTSPTMTNFEWSTMLGVATFIWVILIALLLGVFVMESADVQKYFVLTNEWQLFLLVTATLGCLCSWLGTYLWNSGSTRLPVSLGGQMTIFETVFGLMFVYLIEKRLPSPFECLGIGCMFVAIAYSMNLFTAIRPQLKA
jgi:drug/metabolite transporter (DMT)-like permease